jgi:predicted DNA-binding transcriptional regulator AlpA
MTEYSLKPDQLLSTEELAKHTNFTRRFWESRRITGDSPPFITISKRAVRYRWGDVCQWLNSRVRTNTSNQ